ncbi:MAG: hypothetical protein JO290_05300 [Sphingomonadaceae bacterium]|nr:hypothetical protein [Sphingomonadaceae bacterium]
MLSLGMLRRLARDRRGVAAFLTAVSLPVLLLGMAYAVENSLAQDRNAQLQAVADAAAGGARQVFDSFTPSPQGPPIVEAKRIAALNSPAASVTDADVKEGWWDITKRSSLTQDQFTGPIAGQTGLPFSNAVRVTAHIEHPIGLARLLGISSVHLSKTATAYKCSNLDYPLTLIPDDVPAPSLPVIYMSWATPGHSADTSYYYEQPDGTRNPVFKFYSPYDGEDVSFVLWMSNGYGLQVDTYCRGTFLVSPAEFDSRNFHNWDGSPVTITGYVLRGSTNNSFEVYPDQQNYPFAQQPTPYNTKNEVPTPQYTLSKIKTTPYPSANGIHYWASEGNPTPDRRALLVR